MAKTTVSLQSTYIRMIQQQVNSDIQAIRTGSLDEQLLRDRAAECTGPNDPAMALCIWLNGLLTGIYDNLEVTVKEGQEGPEFQFKPSWAEKPVSRAPVIRLTPPGPAKQAPAVLPARAASLEGPQSAAEN
jgi:hypothetical protein